MGSSQGVRVFYLDPSDLARDSLRALLAPRQDVVLAGSACCVPDGIKAASELSFDVLLASFELPNDELEPAVASFRSLDPNLPIVVLTGTSLRSEESMLFAFEAGVNTLLTLDVKLEEMIEALHAAKRGESYLQSTLASSLIGVLQNRTTDNRSNSLALTMREKSVLDLLAKGLSNSDIADSINVSLSTVKTELRGMFKKLDVSSRTELLVTAIQVGLVEKPEQS